MILTQKGGPFELSVKRRVNSARDPVEYLAADSLQSCVAACIELQASGPATAATAAA